MPVAYAVAAQDHEGDVHVLIVDCDQFGHRGVFFDLPVILWILFHDISKQFESSDSFWNGISKEASYSYTTFEIRFEAVLGQKSQSLDDPWFSYLSLQFIGFVLVINVMIHCYLLYRTIIVPHENWRISPVSDVDVIVSKNQNACHRGAQTPAMCPLVVVKVIYPRTVSLSCPFEFQILDFSDHIIKYSECAGKNTL